jgi:transcriptional regulator with XRE-family HTH domain
LSPLWGVRGDAPDRIAGDLEQSRHATRIRQEFMEGAVTEWRLRAFQTVIRHWPEFAGRSNRALADLLGVHRATIDRIESDRQLSAGLYHSLESAAGRSAGAFAAGPFAARRRWSWIAALGYARAWLEGRATARENRDRGMSSRAARGIHPLVLLPEADFALLDAALWAHRPVWLGLVTAFHGRPVGDLLNDPGATGSVALVCRTARRATDLPPDAQRTLAGWCEDVRGGAGRLVRTFRIWQEAWLYVEYAVAPVDRFMYRQHPACGLPTPERSAVGGRPLVWPWVPIV